MALKMTDCHFEGNGTGIKAPTSAEIEISGTTFKDNGKAMDIFVSSSDLKTLGLPEDTPQEYIREVLHSLEHQKDLPTEQKLESISNSNLFKWLGHGASVASIGSALITFLQSL
jgi:hypothetical protein